ncbi:SDR family NAD(P)-dependent oxidoreductase [Streptomyces sp. NBC_01476]|uniref:SDR family NAD(P)-dependent oxidoreductase n=1 Tax=Streptomyces sp. NBC_01476 TaxID=2903881 RepID=UPI002E2FC4F4|nr:SDR family NAD(P)-dependent oxidoreductase [Streptomyces sp. NBC_01476]
MARTWLITGASRGLGRELSRAVLENGDRLLATARRPEQLSEFAERYGDQVRTVALDVTDAEAAEAAVRTAVAEFGGLDVVANNAGYANSGAIEDTSPAEFRAQIETNLFGVINVSKAALPVFRKQRSGLFLQFSSVGGRVGATPGLGPYQTAKFGLEGFSEVLAAETEPLGIKVVIVEPGGFRTDWAGSSMAIAETSEDYAATVGWMHTYRAQSDGKQPGDPARAARILVKVAGLADPPRRLLLGSDAVDLSLAAGRTRQDEAVAWAPVGRAADFASDVDLGRTSLEDLLAQAR